MDGGQSSAAAVPLGYCGSWPYNDIQTGQLFNLFDYSELPHSIYCPQSVTAGLDLDGAFRATECGRCIN